MEITTLLRTGQNALLVRLQRLQLRWHAPTLDRTVGETATACANLPPHLGSPLVSWEGRLLKREKRVAGSPALTPCSPSHSS